MIITQTPLRISLAGGGTDFPDYYEQREGYVVSAAIDKAVFVIVTARYDDKIYINYSHKEIVESVDEIRHELVREAMRLTGVTKGVEITLLSDIPSEGTGLGSSSSFTVGLLNALHLYQGEQVGLAQLAEEACEVELCRCGKPIGKQDQYIAVFGGVAAFRFQRNGRVEVTRLGLSDRQLRRLSANLFLFYTNQTRKAENILRAQKNRTSANLHFLDAIKELAFEVRDALHGGDFDRIGRVLDKNWRMKKQLAAGISNGRIDGMHALAMRAGATGGKLCGAGGGGFLMVYCPPSAHDRLLRGMAEYREMPFLVEPSGSKAIFNYRRFS
ncbi:MAG: GHMP kinase [Candidatus Methylomirabilales bacterium]